MQYRNKGYLFTTISSCDDKGKRAQSIAGFSLLGINGLTSAQNESPGDE